MSQEEGGLFVWLPDQRGPVPEKWPYDMPDNGNRKMPLVAYKLGPEEFAMQITILEQRYPPPAPPPEPVVVTTRPRPPAPTKAKEPVE